MSLRGASQMTSEPFQLSSIYVKISKLNKYMKKTKRKAKRIFGGFPSISLLRANLPTTSDRQNFLYSPVENRCSRVFFTQLQINYNSEKDTSKLLFS
ncbi:hypothetical protein MIMGU_mgv1a017045mg [Erythranthe guttata]|uniref:Uncharacterized protein n=1 Tax=Erythranthe guttata TaxID=4155 RepID=A0A022R6T0_ERYGU|nr:hypothetical protein MIMGU_mgv1a017045mg [Erythranthe guttata]